MSSFREHRRATAFLFALTLAAVSTKGLCLMPAAAGGKGGPHDCCRKGWQTAPPACCMAGLTDGAAATMTARVVAPSSSFPLMSPVPAIAASGPLARHQIVVNRHRDHSPPPIIFLRV